MKRFLSWLDKVGHVLFPHWVVFALCVWSILLTEFITILLSTSTLPGGLKYVGSFFLLLMLFVPAVVAYHLFRQGAKREIEQQQREIEQQQREIEQQQREIEQMRGLGLSEREFQVLHLRLADMTIDSVAAYLHVSVSTVNRDIKMLKDQGLLCRDEKNGDDTKMIEG